MIETIFYVTLYACVSSYGLFKMKDASTILGFNFLLGFLAYILGFLLWLYMLRKFPLSFIFPIAAGSVIIATQLIGYHLLSEHVEIKRLIGITFMLIGITIIYTR